MTSLSPVTERAVIPAAGLASRLAPVSEVVPKALFPIGRHPAIEWVVAEAAAAGCREIAVVINRAQSEIERYLRRRCRDAGATCQLTFVVQDEPRGLGHAILLTQEFCANLPFAVLLPDDLLDGSRPPLPAMAEAFRKTGGAVFAVVSAAKSGPFRLRHVVRNLHSVEAIDKKSTFEAGEMALTGIGRYLLPPSFHFHAAELFDDCRTDELDDDMILQRMIDNGEPVHCVALDCRRYDISTSDGFIGAWQRFGEEAPQW